MRLVSSTLLLAAAMASVALTVSQPVTSALVDAPALLADLRALSADDMQGRALGTAGGARARAYLAAGLERAGLKPLPGQSLVYPFTTKDGLAGGNIAGVLPGTRVPARYLVLSAHFDHIGVRGGVVFNGADDNASGAAALVTLTKYFAAHRLTHSLLVVGFDGEEEGLAGSRAFLRAPPVPADALALDLNVDMIGRDPDNRLFVVGTRQQPFLQPFIARVAASAPVTLIMGHDDPSDRRVEDWTEDSDQFAFLEAHIPGLYFGVEDYAQHHAATDDYETITYGFYVRAVETMIAVVREFDAHLDQLQPGTATGR